MNSQQTYVIHDLNSIKGFSEEYSFLSNFHICSVYFDGQEYGSSEAAYQAAKTENLEIRKMFIGIKPYQAKKMGKIIPIRSNWDTVKYDIMSSIVFDKFSRNKSLRQKLLDTKDRYLEETNHWNDKYWGVCNEKGENNLGKILTACREFWKSKKETNELADLFFEYI